MKSKLNQCAHCAARTDLKAVFSTCGRLYFVCTVHKLHLDLLIAVAAKAGVRL